MTENRQIPFWRMGIAVWLTTGAWVGFVPMMPGTVGAIWGIPLAWYLAQIPSVFTQILIIGILVGVGIPICTIAARIIGRKDPGCIVWDEIVTVPMTFLFISPHLMRNAWILLMGFILHRVFDISKPPPARAIEKLPNGTGIMLDDCVAGVYSCIALHLIIRAVRAAEFLAS